MDNKKLAVCVPTHDGAINYIKEAYLSGMLETYRKYDIDIYYYDSSEDTELEELVAEKQKEGFENVYYVKMFPGTFLDTKLERMFRCEDHKFNYDYIWPCKASTWAEDVTLEKISTGIDKGYDIIVLNPQYREEGYYPENTDREYSDINSFFYDLGAYLTGMAFRIFRKNTLLANVDWYEIFDKYRVWVPNGTFYEIGLIFDQLSKLDNFRGVLISNGIRLTNSKIKGSKSHWRGEELNIWGKCWPSTVERLPDCYDNKCEVIKKKHHLSDIRVLHALRNLGKLNILSFFEFYKSWNRVSFIPRSKLFFVCIKPRLISQLKSWRENRFVKNVYPKYLKIRPVILENISRGKKLVIYGAGVVGTEIGVFLRDDDIKQSYFAVTNRVIGNEMLGVEVVQIDQLMNETEYFVVVAASPRIQKEMKKTLNELNFKNALYLR